MYAGRYQLRRLLDICRVIAVPFLVLSVTLNALGYSSARRAIPWHASFIILWTIVRGLYLKFAQLSEARQLGATHIPCVVGKWPGNLDILFKMLRAFETSYVLDVYLNLFEEYQCTTLNLRILWVDHVCIFLISDTFSTSGQMVAYFCHLRRSITATATNMRYRSYPWIKNTQNLSLQLGSTIFGVAVLKRKECTDDFSHSSKKTLISTVIYRETFLGGGIFNRDDRVRPRSCLQPLFYQWIYILCRNGNSYVLN